MNQCSFVCDMGSFFFLCTLLGVLSTQIAANLLASISQMVESYVPEVKMDSFEPMI